MEEKQSSPKVTHLMHQALRIFNVSIPADRYLSRFSHDVLFQIRCTHRRNHLMLFARRRSISLSQLTPKVSHQCNI